MNNPVRDNIYKSPDEIEYDELVESLNNNFFISIIDNNDFSTIIIKLTLCDNNNRGVNVILKSFMIEHNLSFKEKNEIIKNILSCVEEQLIPKIKKVFEF